MCGLEILSDIGIESLGNTVILSMHQLGVDFLLEAILSVTFTDHVISIAFSSTFILV